MLKRLVIWAALVLLMAGSATAGEAERDRPWGVGWDEGLTVRRWLGNWELALSAGPDDSLAKVESRSWNQGDPPAQHGALGGPLDDRRESGWVRLQGGYRVASQRTLALVGFAGLAYNWVDEQERTLTLDTLTGNYDAWERDRFTNRWLLSVGLRPSWRPTPFLSLEASFGLQFLWEDWEEAEAFLRAGDTVPDITRRDGTGSSFQDLGWDSLSSVAVIVWF